VAGAKKPTDQLNHATTFEVRSVAQEMYADIGIDPAAAVAQWLEQNFTL